MEHPSRKNYVVKYMWLSTCVNQAALRSPVSSGRQVWLYMWVKSLGALIMYDK